MCLPVQISFMLWISYWSVFGYHFSRKATYCFFLSCCDHRVLHSFPTRRSSDLCSCCLRRRRPRRKPGRSSTARQLPPQDRKSTRLNSSHANISYAVFCLKKKTKEPNR